LKRPFHLAVWPLAVLLALMAIREGLDETYSSSRFD
jgi:hypothetical protein